MKITDDASTKLVIWLYRIIRWGFGATFITIGIVYDSFIAIGFGAIMFATGFIRPRRCLNDNCSVKPNHSK